MKKLLAMVLALVMTMSLVVTANAAKLSDMSDAEAVDSLYEVSVGLLTNKGIIAGYPDGSFRPQGNVTRAEMAKMICYSLLGSAQAEKLPASTQVFTDVPVDFWAAKYIQYCYSQGIIGGHGDGTFAPNDNVTGYQAAKMLLVANGYTKKGAYEGTGWEVSVATDAMKNIFKASKTANYNAAATREEAAYYIFNAFALSNQVQYVGALDINVEQSTQVLPGYGEGSARDAFGRPSKTYKITGASYEVPYTPVYSFMNEQTQCVVADKAGIKNDLWTPYTADTYVDGHLNVDGTAIDQYNTYDVIGCQGNLTEVYKVGTAYELVVVNTYLAKVADKWDAVKDAGGHIMWAAGIELDVYGSTLPADSTNTSFAEGQYVLVTGTYADKNADGTYDYTNANGSDDLNIASIEAVNAVSGKVGEIKYNTYGHKTLVIDGKGAEEACKFILNADEVDLGETWMFFYDKQGNVIGAVEPASAKPQWAIMTAIAYEHNGLKPSFVDANLVNFSDASAPYAVIGKVYGDWEGTGVTISNADDLNGLGLVSGPSASSNSEKNTDWTLDKGASYFYQYYVNNGKYDILPVAVDYESGLTVEAGNPVIDIAGDYFLVLDANTNILVWDGVKYTAQKGFASLKDMGNVAAYYMASEAVEANGTTRVSYIVLDISAATYEGATKYAVIVDNTLLSETTAGVNTYTAWIEGVATPFTTKTAAVKAFMADFKGKNENGQNEAGYLFNFVKLTYNAAGEVVAIEYVTNLYWNDILKNTGSVITVYDGRQSMQANLAGAKIWILDVANRTVKPGTAADLVVGEKAFTRVSYNALKEAYVWG